jgi:NRPS condensation-like uncharacterized protein
MMKRKLGAFETAQAITDDCSPFNVVVVLNLENGPQVQRVRHALELLLSRHPCLRVRIVNEKNDYYFEPSQVKALPFLALKKEVPDMWRRIAEEELNARIDRKTGPLFRFTCLIDSIGGKEKVADLIITFHHAVADAPSATHFLRQLLSLCASDAPSPSWSAHEKENLPPPAEHFFPSRFKGLSGFLRIISFLAQQMADELRWLSKTVGKRPPVNFHAKSRVFSRVLSEKLTRDIVRYGRDHGVTPNNMLSIAQAKSVQQLLHEKKEMPCRLFIFPDLRPYLIPPARDNDMASYFSMLRFTFDMNNKEDFRQMVLRLQNRVSRAFAKGEKFLSHLLAKGMMRWMIKRRDKRMGDSALSYTGPVKLAQSYGDTALRGIHGFVSNLGLGPELCAQARLFAGRIYLDYIYLDTDLDQEKMTALADHMQGILEKAVAAHLGDNHEKCHQGD